jgi:hypothetical protein
MLLCSEELITGYLGKINMDLIQYFITDPLRILTLIGGTGGLLYWYDRYQNRSRIKIRLHSLGLVPDTSDQKKHIIFEAENFGTAPVSLEPYVLLKGVVPVEVRIKPNRRLYWSRYNYKIETSDRYLAPHQPKRFQASCDCNDAATPFLWLMTFIFLPTRGRPRRIRVRSASGFTLSYLRYIYELTLFTGFNKLFMDEKVKRN